MKYKIHAQNIFLEDRILDDGFIIVEDGYIKSIMNDESGCEDVFLDNLTLTPGFIDIHVHGGIMHDTMDATYEALDSISKFKVNEGVTSFCPTTVTTSLEKTKNALDAVKSAMAKGVSGAKILGAFIEGPYINPAYKGAHPEEYIRSVDLAEIKELVEPYKEAICSFAIAPELPNASQVIAYLRNHGINVRLGHSNATYQEAIKAVESGATAGIHTYNAMSPLNHREPGLVGAIMDNENIYAELIADLVHVCTPAIRILIKVKGVNKVVLITDCMMAGGLSDGEYMLGELPVNVKNSVCRTQSGALAGSTLSIIDAVKNLVNAVNVSLFDAVKMATQNPAKALNIYDRKGSISKNKKADLIAFDNDFNIKFIMVDGKILRK